MRLIDADALSENLGFAKNCKECKIGKHCTYETFNAYGICTALADAPTVGRWISLQDRIPENDRSYLTVGPRGVMRVAKAYVPAQVLKTYGGDPNNVLWTCEGRFVKATHWMPLPEPPEEGRHENH